MANKQCERNHPETGRRCVGIVSDGGNVHAIGRCSFPGCRNPEKQRAKKKASKRGRIEPTRGMVVAGTGGSSSRSIRMAKKHPSER